MPQSLIFVLSFLGGIAPALLWLWFWLSEDKKHPEPKLLILFAFISGMIAVPLVVPFEKFVFTHLLGGIEIELAIKTSFFSAILAVILWAALEELFKLTAAYFSVLTKKDVDEPTDFVIYLITAALGFAAMENSFFLANPLLDGKIIGSILTSDLRFIGATLLHTVSSATIGVALALSFYKSRHYKKIYFSVGVILSITLHSLFNLLIMRGTSGNIFFAFSFVWLTVLMLMLGFEKVKRVHPVKEKN
ncbi:MAG: hypothetical protein A2836_00460 [Candidatus Taylorbacteria bacterium RIFCSPHIGHO2_01_FULL_45_63]|uniref:Protease PrsW n=1 Tax=Candidatus Taylorbacteria bacterium RIFCSPHIGHO2_02_FULL_45_35 TaxID=1802311 RepID=A0A1G2MT29_9BACT|nr:MAG: hypothetical protein A2836_00460 [Candidatus Taylorbacteria bacterium RIFCSPHIGHO2_01_FULL_45_63]OHA27050.1 MAG: hypothetical protein A3D56_00700 [Candidatus Taylorbacteria bacterium RIFCSPHIGHO2_02_FULL_45_35]OHA34071.1 MAG: hypothetical protein A3A22_03055 [Candidatus Taylorbacteria bacterium RIFCSPLOWO2_01_FULL_45_34b]